MQLNFCMQLADTHAKAGKQAKHYQWKRTKTTVNGIQYNYRAVRLVFARKHPSCSEVGWPEVEFVDWRFVALLAPAASTPFLSLLVLFYTFDLLLITYYVVTL